jgi:tight adherence protein C
MSVQVIVGASLVGAAIPVAWWGVAAARPANAGAALRRGFADVDLRQATLERPAIERTLEPLMRAVADRTKRFTPDGFVERIDERIAKAGKQGTVTAEQVLATKVGLGVVGLVLAFLLLASSVSLLNVLAAGMAVAAGWMGPDMILRGRGDERAKTIQHELPDFMDQVTIAVEAGLGFEAALARVAGNGHGILAAEIARTLQDIQLGVPRTEALDGLSGRCGVPELRQFVTAIRQAERYGLAIANVLRIQSNEIRDKRRQRAEEHAMKIPVKVLFPLVLCILPTLFIVILGPGGIRMARAFGG